jgi:uncharacterized protein (TIGR02646 family)
MIFINRSKVNAPDILIDKSKKGKKETEKNIQFAIKNMFSKMSFSVYCERDVKEALIQLFKGKCAYCESKFLHVYSGDVEHFRPKGEIEEATPRKKPGYYWLAAEWTNLLLSCRNCNQKLKHQIFGGLQKATMGKMNQFPLENNFKHIQSHKTYSKKIKEEEQSRLLINPCIENPESFFKYEKEGVIKPKKNSGKEFKMAEKSISVYVLQRMPLVQAREKVNIEINAQMERVLEAVTNLNESMNKPALNKMQVIFDKILKREMVRLKKFTDDSEEYSGMARQIINDFINNFLPTYKAKLS